MENGELQHGCYWLVYVIHLVQIVLLVINLLNALAVTLFLLLDQIEGAANAP